MKASPYAVFMTSSETTHPYALVIVNPPREHVSNRSRAVVHSFSGSDQENYQAAMRAIKTYGLQRAPTQNISLASVRKAEERWRQFKSPIAGETHMVYELERVQR